MILCVFLWLGGQRSGYSRRAGPWGRSGAHIGRLSPPSSESAKAKDASDAGSLTACLTGGLADWRTGGLAD